MPTTRLHGFTSWDHIQAADITTLPGWDANGSATVTLIAPGLSGIGVGISAPSGLAYRFTAAHDVAVCRVLFKATALTNERTIMAFGLSDNSSCVSLELTTSGKLQVTLEQVDSPITVTSTDPRSLAAGTVYAIEFGTYFHESNGEVRVLLNGLEDTSLHLKSVSTQANVVSNVERVVFTNPDGQYDDWHLRAGNNGLRRTDFLSDTVGNPKFVTLRPTADGEYSSFPGASEGVHHQKVNETGADGDTSFLFCDETVAERARESWIMNNMTALPQHIYSLASVMQMKTDVSTERDLRQFLRYSSADFEAADGEQLTTDYAFYVRQWDRSPASQTYWTRGEINDAELGLIRIAGPASFEDRVSQAVFVVMYTDAPLPSFPNATTDAAISQLRAKTHHLVSLFRIERPDGFSFHFTDHNAALEFLGERYEPVGGVDPSARRREVALKEQNLDIAGIISSEKITSQDIRAGRYRGAIVTEYLVDWRFPWAGAMQTSIYQVQSLSQNGHEFVAQLAGLTSRLRHQVGHLHTRACPYDLGDMDPSTGVLTPGSHCKIPIDQLAYRAVRVSTVTDNRIFTGHTSDIHGLRPDDWFAFGVVLFRTGLNQGLAFQVKNYESGTRRIELQLPAPFTIAVNDRFDIWPGCNKLRDGDCRTKYDNVINFGGEPFMTGTDQYLQTPAVGGG